MKQLAQSWHGCGRFQIRGVGTAAGSWLQWQDLDLFGLFTYSQVEDRREKVFFQHTPAHILDGAPITTKSVINVYANKVQNIAM